MLQRAGKQRPEFPASAQLLFRRGFLCQTLTGYNEQETDTRCAVAMVNIIVFDVRKINNPTRSGPYD